MLGEQFCIGRSEFYYSNLLMSILDGGEIVNFSETLQKMMETKGVTKYRLAKDLSISQSTVTNWLEGRMPHPFMMDKVYAYFGRSAFDANDMRSRHESTEK